MRKNIQDAHNKQKYKNIRSNVLIIILKGQNLYYTLYIMTYITYIKTIWVTFP